MAVQSVSHHIQNSLSDGKLTANELKLITSREDHWLKKPVSVGTFFDKDEFQAIAGLRDRVQSGVITASTEAKEALDRMLEKGPDKRWKHILKGGPIVKKHLRNGAIAGGTLLGGFGAIMGLGLQGWKLMLIAGPIWALAGAAIGLAGGYIAGAIHGAVDD